MTASGERFDKRAMAAAHRTLPFGTKVRVTADRTGRSVVVRINDRGPFGNKAPHHRPDRSGGEEARHHRCRARRRDDRDPGESMTEPEALLDLRGVAKRYGQVFALRGIDAKVARATKVVGLLGPNGAGKSTLVKCMLGLIPFDGHARVLGYDPRVDGAAIRARVGYMPESDVFLSGMSAVELCAYAAELSGLPRTEALQRAHASLYYAGLEDKRYQNVDGYSTGQKQRVKLAQALVHDPELLFLDEPTNGLDPRSRDEMLELIAELPEKRGCTIMISTHLLTDVDRVCDSALIMHLGQVRFSGTIEQLRTSAGRARDYVIEVRERIGDLYDALTARGAWRGVLAGRR
jgi:ABC-2 type transport system ATP-binding protein